MNQRVGCFYRHFRCENVPAYGPAGRGRAVKWYRGCDMLTVAATRLWAVRRVPGRPGSGSTCGRAEGTYAVVQDVNVRVDVALMAVHRCGQAFSFNRPFGAGRLQAEGTSAAIWVWGDVVERGNDANQVDREGRGRRGGG